MPVKRIETLLVLCAVFAALCCCFPSPKSVPLPASFAQTVLCGGIEKPEICVDADDATIHDLYFLHGGKILRHLTQKRLPDGGNFPAFPVLPDSLLSLTFPGRTVSVSLRAERGWFSFHKILLSSVFPVRAGPRSV